MIHLQVMVDKFRCVFYASQCILMALWLCYWSHH